MALKGILKNYALRCQHELACGILSDSSSYCNFVLGTMAEMKAAEKQNSDLCKVKKKAGMTKEGACVDTCQQRTKGRRKRKRKHHDSSKVRKGRKERKGETLNSTKVPIECNCVALGFCTEVRRNVLEFLYP